VILVIFYHDHLSFATKQHDDSLIVLLLIYVLQIAVKLYSFYHIVNFIGYK
jgi:hypothetical protein